MVAEGDVAPEFTLPAVVDGSRERVALADYVGEEIVILAFYPADFNPACSDETTDLDELDLFTMQKDVSVLGISGDSVYSHRAFAAEYDLHVPLLADVHGEVAREYGVAVTDSDAGYLTRRAVVVIGPDGEVEYVWRANDPTELPDVDDVRSAVDAVGREDTARARYRVGHAHYIEGRRAFTSAMKGFDSDEWMMAQNDFEQAHEEFVEAADRFDAAVRFGEDETAVGYYERAERKAEALWQAAEWLAEAANAYASGQGAKGRRMRNDAESQLETARDIHEPPDPDGFPDEPPAEADEGESVLPTEDDGEPPSLDIDVGEADGPEASDADAEDVEREKRREGTDDTPEGETGRGREPTREGTPAADSGTEDKDDEDEIDEAELEEITAELEEQTEEAKGDPAGAEPGESVGPDGLESAGESPGGDPESPTDRADAVDDPDGDARGESSGSDAENIEGEVDEENLELDLTDPTEGETENGEDEETENGEDEKTDDGEDEETENGEVEETETPENDFGSGDHGVPDSL
jgi:peroxiredoxin